MGDKEDLGEVFKNHLGLVYIPDLKVVLPLQKLLILLWQIIEGGLDVP